MGMMIQVSSPSSLVYHAISRPEEIWYAINLDQDFALEPLLDPSLMPRFEQWSITFLKTDTYAIQNVAFETFAGYVHRPRARDEVLGKPQAKPWIIKSVDGSSNVYT